MIGSDIIAGRMKKRISNEPAVEAVTAVLADVEGRLSDTVTETLELAGRGDVSTRMVAEDRQDELLEIIEAVMSDSVVDWWIENVAPDVVDKPEEAREYLSMTGEEWDEQIEKWYRTYHERGAVDTPLEDASDEAIAQVAEVHVETTFGVCFEAFVREIVDWEPHEAIRRQLTKHIEQNRQAVMVLQETIEEQNERIEELEQQVDKDP